MLCVVLKYHEQEKHTRVIHVDEKKSKIALFEQAFEGQEHCCHCFPPTRPACDLEAVPCIRGRRVDVPLHLGLKNVRTPSPRQLTPGGGGEILKLTLSMPSPRQRRDSVFSRHGNE